MKQIVTLFILSPFFLFSQETEKVTEKHDYPPCKEIYYVLKSDKYIKQGSYSKTTYKDVVLENGFYKGNLKDSLWTEFYTDGKTKKTHGNYSFNKKIGIWEFYNYKGEQELKYNFTTKEVISFLPIEKEANNEYCIIQNIDTIKTKVERPPLYIGRSAIMNSYVIENIRYPQKAKENGTSGTVYISFIINKDGETSHYKVQKGIGSGCDEEALEVVKGIPDNWIPAKYNGQSVTVEFVLPINFTMH